MRPDGPEGDRFARRASRPAHQRSAPRKRQAQLATRTAVLGRRAASAGRQRLTALLGGPERTRVIVVLACVLALASADAATVGASATALRHGLHIDNADVGLLVAVSSLVGAVASVPFGMLADRIRRTTTLSVAVSFWGVAMLLSATATTFGGLLFWRLWLGVVTAAAGPAVASLVGDYFPSFERGKIYSYILTGELVGAGLGFAVTGDIAALSWRAAFVILALAAFPLSWFLSRLPEPVRGGTSALVAMGAAPAGGPASPGYQTAVTTTDAVDGTTDAHGDRQGSAGDGKQVTEAQLLAAEQGVAPDMALAAQARRPGMGLVSAVRYVLAVRTNVMLILSSACGYYFLAGVETFGVEFVHGHYHVNTALANLLMIAIGGGAAVGVMTAGPIGDALLHRGRLPGRVTVAAVAASVAVILFVPALITTSMLTALPYLIFAAMALSAQNPPIDAARLDIMPASLWGRAEGIRTFLRTVAQALAPLLFGVVSDYVGLSTTFKIMLLPLAASAYFLFRARRTYPRDVATAARAATPPAVPTSPG
ncbi:MAG TPA: MFS transporter [Acidimicrobiales bacterium]|nr:MFS transporter [Acidimicrobiales bacterium]